MRIELDIETRQSCPVEGLAVAGLAVAVEIDVEGGREKVDGCSWTPWVAVVVGRVVGDVGVVERGEEVERDTEADPDGVAAFDPE